MPHSDSVSLLDCTRQLLAERGSLTLKEIAKESGVGESWLNKVHINAIPNPGVNDVQRVHDYLLKVVPRSPKRGKSNGA